MGVMRRKTIGPIITIIALAVGVIALWYFVPGAAMDDEGIRNVNVNDGDMSAGGVNVEHAEHVTAAAPGSELSFYDASRADRYDAFAETRQDLAFEDVVWMVNVDLDKESYEDVSVARDAESLQVLVTKHFRLPDGFVPPNLVNIGQSMMRLEAAEAAQGMIDAAAAEGHRLWVQSGYRSFDLQARLYDQYSARDGAEGADRYSARPGHSEHQTGLVADLNTITDAFGDTPEGKWVAANCWYFGFIVRYTTENSDVTLYKTEPWHLRHIGKEAAAGMHDLGIASFEEYWARYINR